MSPLGRDLPCVIDGDAVCENGKVQMAYFGDVWRTSNDQNNVQLRHFIISLLGIFLTSDHFRRALSSRECKT